MVSKETLLLVKDDFIEYFKNDSRVNSNLINMLSNQLESIDKNLERIYSRLDDMSCNLFKILKGLK
jgi:hypothetical protein